MGREVYFQRFSNAAYEGASQIDNESKMSIDGQEKSNTSKDLNN